MFAGFWSLFTGGSDLHRQIQEMRALDDRQLADLGIARDQIAVFVRSQHGATT